MASPKIVINIDDGSLSGLTARAKELRKEFQAATRDMREAQSQGRQVSRELLQRVDKAKAELGIVDKARREKKFEEREAQEEYHTAHHAERTFHQMERVFDGYLTRKFLSGEKIGGKDVLAEIISSDRLIKNIAKQMGAEKNVLTMIGSAGVVAKAALIGWEIGSKIRENIDKADEMRTKLAEQAASAHIGQNKKLDVFSSQNAFGGIFNFKGEEYVKKIEEFTDFDKNLTATELGSALTSSRKRIGGDKYIKLDTAIKQWQGKHDQETAAKLLFEIGQAENREIMRRGGPGFKLDEETRKAVRENVIADFVLQGLLSGSEAEEVRKAKHHTPEETLSMAYKKQREKEIYEVTSAVFDKRVPASPMD